MTRLILDTCAVIELITSSDTTELEFWDVLDAPDTMVYASFETARELVVLFNKKKLLSKYWQTADQMLTSIEQDYYIEFLSLRRDTAFTYSRLQINEAQEHRDPSDHVIIAHAITEKLTLLSSDHKFAFYRNQGLDLIEY
ncbi:MAG: PIN domain-containing protein [Prevotella sp.]|nr:PIN domain-containing protein [Prevotella sp.]MBR6494933.1 PIN domain-containing protein [Prevotella sp.]